MSLDAACSPCGPGLAQALAADPLLAQAWPGLPRRQWPAGAMLLAAGEPARELWFIESGLVRLYCLAADGLERNKSFHAEGAWIGAGVPPLAAPSPYFIEALEPVTAAQLSYAELLRWSAGSPAVGQLLAAGLARVFARLAAREAELLLLDAPARYRAYLAEYAAIAARVPLRHVAGYLGITNVALSRIRRRLGVGGRTRPVSPGARPSGE
ncbi:Crp/Fnr family transcriptional regulator [Aquincola sp. S2]|uniref:Crp/Fnr family transcriptional regulator n=1 Tax=Pseudaquabacterium terrae TaxID=2732868 RepID=A0ABX2EP28_9BURK|nr:Crp/Fnr family transcriptional regulator [Aquabacterium terrae]NRF70407.1 Crp/Fnr family transcriptional regulator [Aquabacterium terrae]